MPEPLVLVEMRQFKQQLLARDADQMRVMAKRWTEVERQLDANISLLSREVDELHRMGKSVSPGKLYRLDRYKSLKVQTEAEFERYAAWATREITEQQAQLAKLGLDHAVRAIGDVYSQSGIVGSFDRLPVRAVENMAGIAGDGKPVGDLLKSRINPYYSDEKALSAWTNLTNTLVKNTALGINPRETARAMRDDLAGGLQKGLTIARTEQLRVYRQASQQQYEESGVVSGHKRVVAHDPRTCLACLADEGTVYPVSEPIFDHPRGRCSSVPVLIGMPEPEFQTGEEWLKTLPEEQQRKIMGNGQYEAWRAGTPMKDFITRTDHPIWGPGLTPTPVGRLPGAVRAEKAIMEPVAQRVPEFKTAKEAETWAIENGLAKEVYYKDFDPMVANDINRSLAEHKARFPQLRLNAVGNNLELNKTIKKQVMPRLEKEFDAWVVSWERTFKRPFPEGERQKWINKRLRKAGYKMPRNTYAAAWKDDNIFFSKKWGSNPEAFAESLREGVASGFHPPGCDTVKSVMDHEIGHALDNQLPAMMRDDKISDIFVNASRNGTMPSKYAWKNKGEFISESWAEYLNSEKPRQVATSVGKRVLELAGEAEW